MLPKPAVYFSYAWGDDETPEGRLRAEAADTLFREIKKREGDGTLRVVIDREKMQYRDRIRDFTKQYADAALVIMIISEKYLRSKYCMGEVVEVLSNRDYRKRIFPVVLPDARLNDDKQGIDYQIFWEKKKEELKTEIARIENIEYAGAFVDELRDIAEIIRIIGNFTTEIGDTLTVRPPDYQPLLDALDEHIRALSSIPPGLVITGQLAAHCCDRREILARFDRRRDQLTAADASLQCYLLADQKYGEAESLVRRLITHLKEEMPPNKLKYHSFEHITIEFVEFHARESADDFRFALRKAFNRGLQQQVTTLNEFVQHPPAAFAPFAYLPFAFKIRMKAETWERGGETAFAWFVQEFCKLPAQSAKKAFFFFIVELEMAEAPAPAWKRFLGKPTAAPNTQETLETFAQHADRNTYCTALPPLQLVDKRDLLDWYRQFEKNELLREQKTNALIAQLGGGNQWPMSQVEVELKKIVEQANHTKNGF